jgi:hypothetical protein
MNGKDYTKRYRREEETVSGIESKDHLKRRGQTIMYNKYISPE